MRESKVAGWSVYRALAGKRRFRRSCARRFWARRCARRRCWFRDGDPDRLSARRQAARAIGALAAEARALGRGEQRRGAAHAGRTKSTRSGARSRPPPASCASAKRERDKAERRAAPAVRDARPQNGLRAHAGAGRRNGAARAGRGDAAAGAEDGGDRPATGGIAHDFNNMLAIVLGSLDLAQAAPRRAATRSSSSHLASAQEGAERAAALTQRLLAFARQQPLAPGAGRRQQAGRRACPTCCAARLGETIQLETVLAGGLWRRQCRSQPAGKRDPQPRGQCARRHAGGRQADDRDRQRLSRRRLCGRACRRPGGPIRACIAVTDTGIGMTRRGRREGVRSVLHHQDRSAPAPGSA